MGSGIARSFREMVLSSLALVALFGIALAAARLRFAPWFPGVLFGDDLHNYLSFLDGHFPASIIDALTESCENKYRPIFHLALGASFQLFGSRVVGYLTVNWLLHGLNAVLVGLMAWRLSGKSIPVALAGTLMVASSRFALYQVTQITGLIEGLALTFGLIVCACVVLGAYAQDTRSTYRYAVGAVVAAAFALHVHERYIVMFPWLMMCFWMPGLGEKLPLLARYKLCAALIAVGAGNYAIRCLVLQLPYFMGTGGQPIKPDISMLLEHLSEAAASLLGFNKGPEYLAATSLRALPKAARFSAIVLASIVLLMLSRRLHASLKAKNKWQALAPYLQLLILIGFLLAPAITTLRLEQRWLVAPQVCLLLLMAKACGDEPTRVRSRYTMAFVLAMSATLVLDTYISTRFDRIFFVYSVRTAEWVRTQLDTGRIPPGRSPLVLDLREEHCQWTLANGEFFRIYGSGARALTCTKP